jgi:DNA polymerase III subunit epsilon
MHDDGQMIDLEPTVFVAVIDTETTGLDPDVDEVIGLGMICIEVTRNGGRNLGTIGSYVGWCEPKHMSMRAQALTGKTLDSLRGMRLDIEAIETLLEPIDLVVAHAASFDRRFLAPVIPLLSVMPWACSLSDIDWTGVHRQPNATIDHLKTLYRLEFGEQSPEGDCKALVDILGRRLPNSQMTGFHALISASDSRRP